eukprot:TRINITY_DN1243_c0_g1_i2.p1 TRINITY_DN1243_c0_g1~~TRINITY_DN1243_c0_g1_i2.p1  ORF type:complete len:422 (-),score=89.00 TRINITY_DN1243_c0_g1_i2:31-1296(-)
MYKSIAVALVFCLSAVNADWLIQNYYPTGTNGCSTPSTGSAYPLNTCISSPYSSSSSFYNFSSSSPNTFTELYYSSTKDCTGTYYDLSRTFDKCNYNTTKYTYSATVPKLSGSLTTNRAGKSCTGATTGYSVSYFNVCNSYGGNTSSNTVYYGGSQCISQNFDNPTCSGTATSAYSVSSYCSASSGTTYGCAFNGAYLPESTLAPTVDPTAIFVTKVYSYSKTCAGNPDYTVYSRLTSCNGDGVKTTVNGNVITSTYYDNYNCTGYVYKTDSDDTIGSCDNNKNSNTSSLTTSGSFPASVTGPVAIYQDSCTNPTITYSVFVPATCTRENATHSYTLTCAQPVNGNITVTTSTYASTDCSGRLVATDVDNTQACVETNGFGGGAVARLACGATFPTTSTSGATTITAAFSVVVMIILAFAL